MAKRLSLLLGQLGDPSRRREVSEQVARAVGAQGLVCFLRDSEGPDFQAAPGYQLNQTRAWKKLLEKVARQATAHAEVTFEHEKTTARAYASGDLVLVLLGGEPRPQPLLDVLPLLQNLFRLEQQLQTNRESSDFLGYANHEIRTPMAAMLGYVDILQRQTEDPDDRHYLEIIQRNGFQLLETLNDLFDLSRIRIGGLQMESEAFEVIALIGDIRNQWEPLAQEKGLSLQVFFDTLIPRQIVSDRARLRQILCNLLSDAIKNTARGWVRLNIRYGAGNLEFSVANSGTALRKLPDHHNIGLSISQGLVQLLGGKLELSSQPGKGFFFHLASPEAELVDGNAGLMTAPLQDYQLRDLSGLSALVVDDREDIREIVRVYLEDAGVTVYTTGESQTALEFLKKKTVSVIVLDMQMPGLDGYATARALRQKGMSTPILALTANATRADREVCLAAGCNGYLSKPVDRGALIGQVWALAYTLHVLVVEDSPLAAHALKSMLESMGCTVEIAHSGEEMHRLASQAPPTVVLMDLGLPDVDGWQLLDWLRQNCPKARVLAHTGRRPEEMNSPDPGLAFDGYLQKPAARQALLQSLFPRIG